MAEESCDLSHSVAQAPKGPGRFCPCVLRDELLLAVAADGKCAWPGDGPRLALRSLVCVWLHPTRLETRTKECKRRASLWVENPRAK